MKLHLLWLALALSACQPYDGTHPRDTSCTEEADTDADGDADGDADSDADSDADTDPQPPVLDSSHPGWANPCCATCHDSSGHRAGLDPYECVTCHGDNGAPNGHGRTSGCDGCHGTPHCGGDGFPVPDACLSCHPN
jgi:hypothetical protein